MVTDPTTSADFITAGVDLITSFGLMPVIMAFAIVGVATSLFRKAKSAAR